MSSFSKKYKANKIKTFLFFLGLSVIFWALTKFSSQQTTSIDASLVYDNIPSQLILSENNRKEISFEVATNGFEALLYSLKRPEIVIDVSQFITKGDSIAKVSEQELKKRIAKDLDKSSLVKNISVSGLDIIFDKVSSKEIPIKVVNNLTFKNGFRIIDSIISNPNSIVITGPDEIIKNIEHATTKDLILNNIDESSVEELELLPFENPKVVIKRKKVSVIINVAEFTQKTLVVPLILRNTPDDVTIKMIPQNVKVAFDVSVTEFNSITENDFELVCDYTALDDSQEYMLPVFTKLPTSIYNIELQPKKVNFLIFK